MNRSFRRTTLVLVPLCALVVAFGCSKKPKPEVTPPPVQAPTPPPTPPPPPPPPPVLTLNDVFFDFDKYNLRDDAMAVLKTDGQGMMDITNGNVLLEGHCDERGTVEYNLALGQKRADAVKSYLTQYGVDAARLSTISYGEERPFAQGHDESAWSQNRRVHFVKQ
jgi:peptidoglycan-associated lipoprotein